MTRKRERSALVPDFDVSLWGYDRQQVQWCVHDLARRLEQALARLDSVAALQQELCDTRLELDQLREAMRRQPHWSYRLAEIMRTAEELRERAGAGAGASAE